MCDSYIHLGCMEPLLRIFWAISCKADRRPDLMTLLPRRVVLGWERKHSECAHCFFFSESCACSPFFSKSGAGWSKFPPPLARGGTVGASKVTHHPPLVRRRSNRLSPCRPLLLAPLHVCSIGFQKAGDFRIFHMNISALSRMIK